MPEAPIKISSGYLPTESSVVFPIDKSRKSKLKTFLHLICIAGAVWATSSYYKGYRHDPQALTNVFTSQPHPATCAQADPLIPEKHGELWALLSTAISSSDFQLKAVDWLSRAVQIPTESWDDMDPVGVDPRWEVFEPFQKYLLEAFPLVHSTLKLTKVNTYGLIFEWEGSSPELKPILLAAHQDVVPVEPTTIDKWTHPPFSGHFDGEKIWGRGSSDDKNGLIGVLAAVETLISNEFRPTRTFVLAFGFDEEASGLMGAASMAPVLLDLYGKDGFAFIVDEGAGFGREYGTIFATPGIAEKGYIDVHVGVTSAGGHSSIPPDHTSIGILAAMLVQYEKYPFELSFNRDDPLFRTLQCFAGYGNDMPDEFRKLIIASAISDKALHKLTNDISNNIELKSLIATTQAIDMIHGGVKANALPEQAYAIVNHRIAVSSSLADTEARDTELLKSLAHDFNLTYTAFGQNIVGGDSPSKGNLTLRDAFNDALEPAPVTPTGSDDAPYQLFSGTIKATYNSHRSLEGTDNIIVAPGMMTGNTDTVSYWDLSPSIFRYNHQNAGNTTLLEVKGIHTINEFIEIDSFLEMIRFFVILILNSDESTRL
ncbi:carboxypeptidase S [Macrolepiota fuliginosa MF-IS2]|uniref:Carboxypeptidase S n=1 Tax=Macrolepiota fuliginosa MF-IS2 TaxID=1400762 RepID=A0A9P5XHF4_9AGAR|nr:carboxypeptidase S [Macrolepiota fuliginosa MF-IS2]